MHEIKNYVKAALFNQDVNAFDYFHNEQTKKLIKDFIGYCRPFWHSKQLYEEYYSNKLLYYKLLKNKRYSLKVIILRKNFEMRLKITKKLVKQFACTDCNSQILTMSLMDEIVYGG